MVGATLGFAGLAGIWLPPGVSTRRKLLRSAICGLGICATMAAAAAVRRTIDMTEDRRNSFSAADQEQLSRLSGHLAITVRLAPEDPRFADLRRNVLSKIERAMPSVTIDIPGRGSGDGPDRYGEVNYSYGGRVDMSRSTSHREILPLIYGLAGVPPPSAPSAPDYPGYPLILGAHWPAPWFFGVLPLMTAALWWRSRRPPKITHLTEGEQS